MGYSIDLAELSIDELTKQINNKILIPSRKVLKEDLINRMISFKNMGINNVAELLKNLKNSEMLSKLLEQDIYSEDFLQNLRREINSMSPKPNRFIDFKFLDDKHITTLHELGIKNTKALYPKIITKKDRKCFSDESNLPEDIVLKLAHLVDISRIKWVNHTFAYVLYESGYNSVNKVSKANAEELHNKIKTLNQNKEYYKGNIGLNDIRILIEAANVAPKDIIF